MENFISCAVVARTPTNDEGLSDFHHSMSMVLVTWFHIWFIMTIYYKMLQFYYKIQRLLQIATVQSVIKRLINIKSQKKT